MIAQTIPVHITYSASIDFETDYNMYKYKQKSEYICLCNRHYVTFADGQWGSWTAWTICSVSCDSGYQTRRRYCNNLAPSLNGLNCDGEHFEVLNCSLTECLIDGHWGSWTAWTICNCDSGYQTRHRHCNNPAPSFNGSFCDGEPFEVLNCSLTTCPVNGNWGYWSSLSSCNVTCGSGTRKRTRRYDTPFPTFGGSICTWDSKESQTCADSFCPVNGNWGSLSVWTICCSSCDSGFLTRNCLYNNPVPSSRGSYCKGKSFEVLHCITTRCSVDGSWGRWSIWSVCNSTCGGGVQKRTRNCNNPYPSAGGSTCSGIAEETLLCAEINCPVNGDWSEWEVWRLCSSSCGSGKRTRTRLCANPPPSYGGMFRNGNTSDLDSCNIQECPVDGNWSGWSAWNICSATCDGGIQDRTRKCDSPQPLNGGLYCNGTMIESLPCNNINCEIDGQWGTWQEWETCNTTCGNGFKQRIRKCDSPSPYFGGSECMGLDFDIQTCYQDICPDAQLQAQEDTPNSFPPVVLGGVAVICIFVTAAITCIALIIFRRFRPGKVGKFM
ncbi:Thrombospondin-1,Adhesion G protein-coupled receptor B1,Mucin-like protein,Hemicentin-1,Adhesion G protein-coupled receptor B3,Thrombospondin-2 [Mytilus coruscus]|uniref:Thrombospondin-1,Adhesion G protein-coupled receptor B1,Mucin-like protein,Hemicentin-1,Adhesion G protein-coupled receptor B3,Thrombospondin-2 n=1 Tax=Mytilus coruscus TaxID=42192 RepID=A0A6J8ET39_MYTCO|nr:Thrombospondin-1,Adhesion G protein-coupled receptor B1,Mucin-like protein,Hemicentin-1,Adhesion G protein-coupled receptor B3,Thrombospondin-2 [Mytilus coruscus]